MATTVGIWEGLYSAIADTIWEYGAGRLVTRVTASAAIGATTITVEATDRFPAAGDLALGGRVYAYTSKTTTTFVGLVERLGPSTLSGTSGLVEAVVPQVVVLDDTESETQMDKLRRSFLVLYAEGSDLDVIGANYGTPRPTGIDDATYRALLQVIIAIEAQTIFACEKVLDVLVGAGLYELYERAHIAADRHKVFVQIPNVLGDTSEGKTYLTGYEYQTRSTATTVVVDYEPLVVYGIYSSADPERVGTNYALGEDAAATTAAANPTRVTSASLTFTAADEGEGMLVTTAAGAEQHWTVESFVSGTAVSLAWKEVSDARVTASGNRFITDSPWFSPWVADAAPDQCQITIPSGANAGTYDIAEWISPYEVEITGTFAATETDIPWKLIPNYGNQTVTARIVRATWTGATITAPVTLPVPPAQCIVDYTTVESGQLLYDENVDGNAQDPTYIYDFRFGVRDTLDLILPAGVILETEIL